MKLEVGQKVYIVWNQCYAPREVTITKIGRKYADTNQDRVKINMELLSVGESPTVGRVYFSKQEYEQKVELSTMWNKIIKKIADNYTKPDNVSKENMEQILKML